MFNNNINSNSDTIKFYLSGAVRLKYRGKVLRVHRKSLGLLAYLAIEGSARREELADRLWGSDSGRNSLRVELHKLRKLFSKLGFEKFADQDPIEFPPFITKISQKGKELLEGLEDLSFNFQEWLEGIRAKPNKEVDKKSLVREKLLNDLIEQIKLPHLVFIQGHPGSGRYSFAQGLAHCLDLPLIEGVGKKFAAVRILRAENLLDDSQLEQVLDNKNSLWLVICSSFGEDKLTLLKLRQIYPPDHVSYIKLPPISWIEARKKLLGNIPFNEAAQIYHAAGGNPTFIKEFLHLRPEDGFNGSLPQLRCLEASYKLEAQSLSNEARLVLGKLCVHPSYLPEGLIKAFRADPYLEELERCGWLIFKNSWYIVNNHVRHLMYQELKAGQRNLYHMIAAEHFSNVKNHKASAYHKGKAETTLFSDKPIPSLTNWQNDFLNQHK